MLWSLLDPFLDASVVFSFDRTGYARHSRHFAPADLDVDLSGRVVVVTGANAGLGRVVSRELARLGADVWMVCRNRERGEAARLEAAAASHSGRVHLAIADLADLSSVRAVAGALPARRIDVLVNNAGVLLDAREQTADGLERTLATNLVGPHLLTTLLLPRLRASRDGRVITVSSGGMYTQRLDVVGLTADSSETFDGVAAYARTKRAQVVLSELWAEREPSITWCAMHPGWADTPGVRSSLPRFRQVTRAILRTPEEGADTITWLAACPAVRGQTGKFWFDRRPVATHYLPWTREEPGARAALWQAVEEWSGVTRPSRAAALRARPPRRS
jgi:NAD(P)-dependent dehydrogenase (short-subunit alcohol dehydrogenase family)